MKLYRVCREKRARIFEEAFDGMGASKIGGRWNPKGMPAAYTSSSLSLSLLEVLVHADLEDLPGDLVCASVNVPRDIKVYTLLVTDLPKNWRDIDPLPLSLTDLGRSWIEKKECLIMSTPSVIIPNEMNFIINPEHHEFSKLNDFKIQPFNIDPRLGIEFT